MASLSHSMRRDHGRCDLLFSKAEAAAEQARWDECLSCTRAFVNAVLEHFVVEEDVLFPAFEARTGMTEGPTRVMRGEHVQMRELMNALGEAAAGSDGEAFADAAETLLILMQQHNMKEENILYPMCEQTIGDDAAVSARVEKLATGGVNG